MESEKNLKKLYKMVPNTGAERPKKIELAEILTRHSLKLYPYQERILADPSRFRIVLKARQVGISLIIALESTLKGLNTPKHPTILVSASDRQALNIMGYVHQFLRGYNKHILDSGKSFVNLNNGSSIISLPCSPDTIRTFHGDVYLDEFAFTGADNELYRAIQPTISRGYNLTIVSTPNGSAGKFYELWHSDNFSKHQITWEQCPDLKPEIIEQIKATLDKFEFEQEYCCLFHDATTTFLDRGLIESCIEPGVLDQPKRYDQNKVYMGYDLAKLQHGSVVSELERNHDGTFYLRHQKVFNKLDYGLQLQYLESRINNIDKVFLDRTGVGERIFEELGKKYPGKVQGINFTLASKEEMMSSLWLVMSNGKLKIPNDPILIDELHSIKRITTTGGHIRYEGAGVDPRGHRHHGDRAWSIAMPICYGSKTPDPNARVIVKGPHDGPSGRLPTRQEYARQQQPKKRW